MPKRIIKRASRILSGVKNIGIGAAMGGAAMAGTFGLRAAGSQSSKFSGLVAKALGRLRSGISSIKRLGGDVPTLKKHEKLRRTR